jgi:hypothetical protein
VTKSHVAATAVVVLLLLCAWPPPSEGSDGLRVGLKLGWPWSWIVYNDSRERQSTDDDTHIFSGASCWSGPCETPAPSLSCQGSPTW